MQRDMFVVPAAPRNPRGKAFTVTSIDDDAMIVCSPTPTKTVYSPSDTVEKRSSSPPISTDKDVKCPPSPPLTPRRRAIFNEFWERNASSSSIKEDDYSEESGREVKQSPKLKPSYLGIYSFAPPSPLIAPKPSVVSPVSSTDSLTNSNSRPKSILRRHHSLRDRHGALMEGPKGSGNGTTGRTRSASLQLPFVPALYLDDASVGSRSSSDVSSQQRQHHSNVHFDPTITVREVIDEHSLRSDDSNWFSDNELGSFMNETINLCHSSAINAIKSYSLPSVAKAYAAAHEAGIKDPVVSCNQPEYRALFADPILHSTDEDAIVHDGSKEFFKIMSNEVQNVLIVDNSRTTLKLFKRHMLSMFPHVHIDMALSGEEALNRINFNSSQASHVYDIIIAEEHLYQHPHTLEEEKKDKGGNNPNNDHLHQYQTSDLLGSELLQLVTEIEATFLSNGNNSNARVPNPSQHKIEGKEESSIESQSSRRARKSLKIGVSVSLGEDCESLRKGGADIFWSKPPPKPSNGLRNQVLNTLINKRGKTFFICGC